MNNIWILIIVGFVLFVVLTIIFIVIMQKAGGNTTTQTNTAGTTTQANTTGSNFDWSGLKKFWPIVVAVGVAGAVYYFLQNGGMDGGLSSMQIEDWQKHLLIALAVGVLVWLLVTKRFTMLLMILFTVAILYVILSNFGLFESSKPTGSSASEVNIVVWKLNSPTDSTVVYNGPTPWENGLPFRFRVTPECGRSITILAPGWDHGIILTGCNPGTTNFPPRREGGVKIRAVK